MQEILYLLDLLNEEKKEILLSFIRSLSLPKNEQNQ